MVLDPRKTVKQVQKVSGTKGEGVDLSWTQVVYVLAHSLEREVSEHTEGLLFLQPGYPERAGASMSHTYPACIL